MKKLVTILLLSVMTTNLIISQNIVDISQTIEKQIDGEWALFVNDEKFTGIVFQDWEDKTHEKTYKDGKLNGIYKAYYSNGNLAFLGNFKNGKKQGLCKWYYENGNLEAKGNYDKDNQVDFHEWYYENGKMKEKSIIKNGEYTSTQKFPENKKIEIRDSLLDSLWTALDDEAGLAQQQSDTVNYTLLFPKPLTQWLALEVIVEEPDDDPLLCNNCIILNREYYSPFGSMVSFKIESEDMFTSMNMSFLELNGGDSFKKNRLTQDKEIWDNFEYKSYSGYIIKNLKNDTKEISLMIGIGSIIIRPGKPLNDIEIIMKYLDSTNFEKIEEFFDSRVNYYDIFFKP